MLGRASVRRRRAVPALAVRRPHPLRALIGLGRPNREGLQWLTPSPGKPITPCLPYNPSPFTLYLPHGSPRLTICRGWSRSIVRRETRTRGVPGQADGVDGTRVEPGGAWERQGVVRW